MTPSNCSGPAGTCTCGCCLGLTALTPVKLYNRQGLSAIAYRVGTQPQFKGSMLAALSSSSHLALARLGSRDDDDFSIALLDAWACVAEVLTFYQERIANESYLATAGERESLLQLARLIGYELRPGVAASAYVAFTLETAQGSPPETTIDIGAKIQSIPGPNETPQTFETVEAIDVRADWNALTPRLSEPQTMTNGLLEIYLDGVETQLQPGDAILIIGSEREKVLGSEQWDFRLLDTVETYPDEELTRVTWLEGLGHDVPFTLPAQRGVRVFALRQRAALFGHNAPDPHILHLDASSGLIDAKGNWLNYVLNPAQIDLDAVYPKITAGSWVVFASPDYWEVSRVSQVTSTSDSRFALSGKFTRFVPDILEHSNFFDLRNTTVFAQSEALTLAERPIRDPVYGASLALDQLASDLQPGQALAFSGKRQRLQVTRLAHNLQLTSSDGTTAALAPGDSLQIVAAPVLPGSGSTMVAISPANLVAAFASATPITVVWQLRNRDGFDGSLTAATDVVALAAAADDDATVTEIAFINGSADAVQVDSGRTRLKLRASLLNCYDRTSLSINANVALATHGESVQEVLGAGDASSPYQTFRLKQSPLTYVSAATASGAESTLEIRVNDLLWQETDTLYGHGARERIYVSRNSDSGATTVEFGDGLTGARLPTGQDNVRATYRKGIGLNGLVKAGQLSQLMTRPLGVKAATNPEDASGAADPESLDDARQNGPLTVLTLDRTVSLLDYQNFARAFGGIAKALATWTWDGHDRRVLITVAGPDGAEVKQDSDTLANLIGAITNAGDPFVSFDVRSYRSATFRLLANVKVDEPTYVRDDVLAAVETALRGRFSFDQRDFAQPVVLSEVIAVVQHVDGVVGLNVTQLYRADSGAGLNARLPSQMPSIGPDGTPQAAELLTLDSTPLEFGVLS